MPDTERDEDEFMNRAYAGTRHGIPGALVQKRDTNRRAARLYRQRLKRAFDVVAVLLVLPIALPVMVIIAILLRVEGGAVWFTQQRLGQDGYSFNLWKFRTMVVDADSELERYLDADPSLRAEWDATQKLKKDPRITRTGRILRKTSLDELPQLFNILRGEMSVVGPRPMLVEQLDMYGPLARHYFALRPGLKGLWQVSDRNNTDFARRAEIDAVYEQNLSMVGDIKIIFATFAVIVRGTGY